MRSVRLSIIVPVYNAEDYLEKCLDSITSQTLQNIEIICIDDGSTDRSWSIIQKFAKRDPRVITLQQQNAGAAVARNKGLERAKGEYIGFVDADDYVDSNYFEELYKSAKKQNADIARAYVKVDNNSDPSTVHKFGLHTYDHYENQYNKYIKEAIEKNKLNQKFVIWLAIFRSKMLTKNNINFPPRVRTGQDVLFNIKTSYFANKIVYVTTPTYYHRVMHDGSLMTHFAHSDEGLLSRTLLIDECVRFLNTLYDYDKDIYISHVIDALYFIYDRKSNARNKDTLLEIAGMLSNTWRQIKYKKEIRKIINNRDARFADSIGNRKKLADYIESSLFTESNGIAVSVVIPIYNQERYIEQCLDSVLQQTLTNIEIICVDDGSTDSTAVILQDYARRDNRIKILTQEHCNAGASRNAGMEIAQGRYLAFLDSDDYFDKTMLEKLCQKAEEDRSDVVVCRSNSYDDATGKEQNIDYAVKLQSRRLPYSAEEIVNKGLFMTFTGWPWDKLFRAEVIRKSRLQFQSIESTNDAFFTYMAMARASAISVVDDHLVYHRINNPQSIENSSRKARWDNLFLAEHKVFDYLRDNKLTVHLASFFDWIIDMGLWNMRTVQEKDKKRFVEVFRDEVRNFVEKMPQIEIKNGITRMRLDTLLAEGVDLCIIALDAQDRVDEERYKIQDIRRELEELSIARDELQAQLAQLSTGTTPIFRMRRKAGQLKRKLKSLFQPKA